MLSPCTNRLELFISPCVAFFFRGGGGVGKGVWPYQPD